MQDILGIAFSYLPSVITIILVIAAYKVTQTLLSKQSVGANKRALLRQTILFVIVFIGFFLVLFALPIDSAMKGQLMSLLGIVLAASISLSSTTLLGNAMAALNLGLVNSFKAGDFLRTKNIFGRVTSKGLFHTEIQTEDRDLMTIPNLYLSTNPVQVIRTSGTIISCSVSLGYDVNRVLIEKTLLQAAGDCELKDPFVFVTELGDYSVVYKISGLLEDVNKLLTVKSNLHKRMLDELHDKNIEIVSPTFMNQRQVNDTTFISKTRKGTEAATSEKAESMIFDKAEKAEKIEAREMQLQEFMDKIKALEIERKTSGDKKSIDDRITQLKELMDRMSARIAEQKDNLKKDD